MIHISKSFMPPLATYNKYLKGIWKTHILTSQSGEFVTQLERKLKKYWKVKNVVCVVNGTAAIQIVLRALDIKEIYTSPFSFIATCAAPAWLGIKLKFIDFDELYPEDKPVLSTHVYGIPEFVRGKPVIYDASHAFTTEDIMNYGEASIISFSAVKVFQTGEGGAIVTNNNELAEKARIMRNYGLEDRYNATSLGTNAKMSELHAAMGLSVLPYVKKIRKKLDKIAEFYNKELGLDKPIGCLLYYPLELLSERKVLRAIKEFESNGIFPRRYFYPPLNKVFGGKKCELAEDYMSRLLTIPYHYYLEQKDLERIVKIAKKYV